MQQLPRGTRSRLRPIDLCLNRIFPVGRPQPHSRSPRSPMSEGPGGATRKHQTRSFGLTTALLLSGSESGPERTYCFGRAKQAPEQPLTRRHWSEGMVRPHLSPSLDKLFLFRVRRESMKSSFGLTLANRGVIIGAVKTGDL